MPYLDSSRRLGRSQGAVIFWGLVSVFFATAFCYYYLKNRENESSADNYRDQVMTLQEQRETLNSQKDKLQASINETENELKTREEFLQEKETKLAEEESQIDAEGAPGQMLSEQTAAQAAVVKKFNDAVRKLAKNDTDVVERGGRPVLRVPDSVFFAFGEAGLRPEGKALLKEIGDALKGQLNNFELRIDAFTDSDGEGFSPAGAGSIQFNLDPNAGARPHLAAEWALTGMRSAAIARFLHDDTPLPFQSVLVVPRADFQPIVPSGKEAHARNRRIEITIAPAPPTFRPLDPADGEAPADATPTASAGVPEKKGP